MIVLFVAKLYITRHSEQREESRFHRYLHEFEILRLAQDDSKVMAWNAYKFWHAHKVDV